jgi:hypothetical protein
MMSQGDGIGGKCTRSKQGMAEGRDRREVENQKQEDIMSMVVW